MCSLLPVEGVTEQDVMDEIAGTTKQLHKQQTYADAVYQSAFHVENLHQKHLAIKKKMTNDLQKHTLQDPF